MGYFFLTIAVIWFGAVVALLLLQRRFGFGVAVVSRPGHEKSRRTTWRIYLAVLLTFGVGWLVPLAIALYSFRHR